MKQYDGKTFLFSSGTLILLLVLISMTSCAPTTTAKKNDGVNPIANVKAIGKALGCMFGGCKSEEQIQKEQNEITKEFDKVDRETKADQDRTHPTDK